MPGVHTSPLPISTTAGTTVHDRATVSGTGPTPTGTVNFTFYTSLDCSTGGVTQSNVTLTAGIADSSAHGPLATGSYSFKAHYNRSEEHTSELQPPVQLVCRPLL